MPAETVQIGPATPILQGPIITSAGPILLKFVLKACG